MTSHLMTSYGEINIAKKKTNFSFIVITDVKLASYFKKDSEFCFSFFGKNTFTVKCRVHGYACMLVSLHYFDKQLTAHFQPTFTFEQTLDLVSVLLWPLFERQVNVQCGIGSILRLISSHIHNAVNRAIAKNSWQSYFKKFEVVFSRKQQSALRVLTEKIILAFF